MRVLDEATLTRIIEQVVAELAQDERPPEKPAPTPAARTEPAAPDIRMPETAGEAGCLPDITEIDIREQYLVEQPEHGEAYADLKRNAPCRLGIGKAGARYKTLPQLEFRAAHSAAQDAVFSDVDEAFIASQGVFLVQSQCDSKDTYLTRPDLGRRLSKAAADTIRERCRAHPRFRYMFPTGFPPRRCRPIFRICCPRCCKACRTIK